MIVSSNSTASAKLRAVAAQGLDSSACGQADQGQIYGSCHCKLATYAEHALTRSV